MVTGLGVLKQGQRNVGNMTKRKTDDGGYSFCYSWILVAGVRKIQKGLRASAVLLTPEIPTNLQLMISTSARTGG